MAAVSRTEVLVIGAGFVGLACALWLQERGHEVTVIDRDAPGRGASYGNAGAIATYGCIPVATPEFWRDLPRLLLSRDSPFVLRWRHLPHLTPWLVRFLRQTSPARMRANAAALSQLLQRAWEDFEPLVEMSDSGDLLRRDGCLYFYQSRAQYERAASGIDLRRTMGVVQQRLDAKEIAAIEPVLAGRTVGGVLFPEAGHLVDPLEFAARMAQAVGRRGGQVLCGSVAGLSPQTDTVFARTDEGAIAARTVVVAAGAWSKPLAASVGDRIPLETERGYHIEYPLERMPLSRPCCPAEYAIYLTPMSGRLRVAGTVELSRPGARPNPRRYAYLERHARALITGLPAPSSYWLGCRPSLPDSLPVIGASPHSPRVIYAFGHGHLGITLAGVTGRLVGELISRRQPHVSLTALRPDRF